MINSPFKLAIRPTEANPRMRMRRIEHSIVEVDFDRGVARVVTQTLVETEVVADETDVRDTERPVASDW